MGFSPTLSTSRLLTRSSFLFLVGALVIVPGGLAFADFGGSLNNIKNTLTHVVLPTLSVIGICFAAFSFFSGHPNSKQHILYAILGCIFGFASESIMNLIRSTVQ